MAASTNTTPMIASWISGQRFSVHVSRTAPNKAAPSAQPCTGRPCGSNPQEVGDQHAHARGLRDGDIDEDDPAGEDLHAEWDMGCCDQQSRCQRRQDDGKACGVHAHFLTARRRSIVSSNKENRSLACGVPPTV